MYASIRWKETIWHENSLNTTMQKKSHSHNWRIHASFTQRVLHVCIAIQRDAHRTRYTQWAVECTVHAEESQICEKYTVYPRRRIVRNITADSGVLHAAERNNIPIFFQQHAGNIARLKCTVYVQVNKNLLNKMQFKLYGHSIKRAPGMYTFLID